MALGGFTRTTSSPEETRRFAESLAPALREGDVLALTGDLGAGKTQFTKGLAEGLGITSPILSPTFNILLTYPEGRLVLNHFDLYRLEDPDELYDIDYFGTMESGGVSVIEWADKFPSELPDDYVTVSLETAPDDTRIITIAATGARSEELVRQWAFGPECRINSVKE
ncbi:MAG: tRNA (adenosine(37)-N6)-threonylcarbamoyltransferase complex ATPase subunit type 1 TsaE [Eggerthellaceae bacterium]|nr:tRNA (adenosine(37)-N6)-threonylcarbamoyltransferase complex ATPase subunit type 1 TsaE [Eggerthellaceae bacterium]